MMLFFTLLLLCQLLATLLVCQSRGVSDHCVFLLLASFLAVIAETLVESAVLGACVCVCVCVCVG